MTDALMAAPSRAEPKRFEVGCTVEVSHTFDSLHAHVTLDGDVRIRPGDEVIVHGEPIKVPYGEVQTFRRVATVIRAGILEQIWTKISGRAEFMELLEFSFSERTRL